MNKFTAAVIKNIRLSHGLTQEKLAEVIERSPGHVGMLEQGRATPSYAVMQKLINEFDIDASLFFGGSRRDAESISVAVIKAVQNMPSEVQECVRLYANVVDQFSKIIRNASESDSVDEAPEDDAFAVDASTDDTVILLQEE
ncbi:MAG: helix-turn-helix transcriptional regulator [Oscillospiraceae bacterium]|nr:helix-turn-helix transcriptional regulator [Oscillospiraceae bacterium]